MCRPLVACVIALPLWAASPTGAAAQADPEPIDASPVEVAPFRISADELAYERERDVYEAAGNVRIEQARGRVLTADWVALNATTRAGVAVGNVVMRDGDDVVRAGFAVVDIDTMKALATRASLDAGLSGFTVSGESLEKTGPSTYRVEEGNFTTCRCPPRSTRRPWEVEVDEADIRVGGYAVARDVKFRVLGFPLLYTPWLILPVKTQRQTGFLIPSVSSSSRAGREFELPFFWAAREDLNLLLRPAYFSKRGLKTRAEFEAVFGERGTSAGGFAILPGDDAIDEQDPTTPFSDNRWAYWLRHEHPLARGLRFGLDINEISDNQYPVDFDDLRGETRSARFLESSAWTTYARRSLYAGIEVSYLDDLQSPNDLDRDDFFLQRLPDVRLASLPRRLGPLPLYGALDVRYTYFHQREDVPSLRGRLPQDGHFFDTGPDGLFDEDEPDVMGQFTPGDEHLDNDPLGGENDTVFQEGELLADFGHRVDLYPRLVLPLRFGPIGTLSEVGFRETLYSPKRGSAASRGLWTGRIDTRVYLARDYVLAGRTLQHIVEPKLAFGFVSDQNQERDPLFIPGPAIRPRRIIDRDLRVLLRNPSDRIADERFLQGGLANRLYGPPPVGGGPGRLIAELDVGAGYDFEESEASDIFVQGAFRPRPRLALMANLGYDPEETRVNEADVVFDWTSDERFTLASSEGPRRHELMISYRYLRDQATVFESFVRSDEVFDDFSTDLDRISQFNFSAKLTALRQLDLFARGYLSLEESSTRGGSVGFVFLSACACWELIGTVERHPSPDDTRYRLEVRLAGLGRRPRLSRSAAEGP